MHAYCAKMYSERQCQHIGTIANDNADKGATSMCRKFASVCFIATQHQTRPTHCSTLVSTMASWNCQKYDVMLTPFAFAYVRAYFFNSRLMTFAGGLGWKIVLGVFFCSFGWVFEVELAGERVDWTHGLREALLNVDFF